MTEPTQSSRPAQEQFGRQAHFYAQSNAFRAGESLDALTQYLAQDRYGLAVDVGTGAGFAAFAASPFCDQVLATDITPQMLTQARRLADERDITNVGLMAVEAESLPFGAGSVGLVTSRQAAHHFYDLPRAIAEVWRVLRPGGVFVFTDPVAPEGAYEERWMNDVEVRRDLTHIRDLRELEWRELLAKTGFDINHSVVTRVYLEFNDWVARANTPQENIEPLRRDLLSARPSVVQAFGIQAVDEDIHFHWDVLVVKAVKRTASL